MKSKKSLNVVATIETFFFQSPALSVLAVDASLTLQVQLPIRIQSYFDYDICLV
jgi:hypothetical protein